MYRHPESAPLSSLPPERRGAVVGRFCRGCRSVYPLHAERHEGKPAFGRDHVASACAWEGRAFEAGASWWEPAVELLSAPAPAAAS
jgi:hypothetical protein